MADFEPFDEIAIIGIGLQGASIAINARDRGLAKRIVIGDISAENCARALELNLGQHATTNLGEAVANADCVFVAVPLGAFAAVGESHWPGAKARRYRYGYGVDQEIRHPGFGAKYSIWRAFRTRTSYRRDGAFWA